MDFSNQSYTRYVYILGFKYQRIVTSILFRLDGKHVVFGTVKEGMDLVKKMESYGSESGKTSKKIKISNSGEL